MSDFGKAPVKMEGGIADPDEFEWECDCKDCQIKYQKWKDAFDIQQKQLKAGGDQMDREVIIRLARVAGCHDNGEEFRFVELRYLERFAALVAAREREECAKVCEEFCDDPYAALTAERIRRRNQE